MAEIKVETYGCLCGYSVDIEQEPGHPRIEPMSEEFYRKRGWLQKGLPIGGCYSCFLLGKVGQLAKIIVPDNQATIEIKSEQAVEEELVNETNELGFPILEQVGVVERKYIQGDEIVTIEEPQLSIKQRERTEQEKQEELARIRRAEAQAALMEHTAS